MSFVRSFAVAAALIFGATAASAAEPAFVGTWGVDAAQCKAPQSVETAPLVMTSSGYDQHEAHCTFTSVKKLADGWSIKARCSVQGDQRNDVFRLKAAGDRLTMTRGGAPQSFARCQ